MLLTDRKGMVMKGFIVVIMITLVVSAICGALEDEEGTASRRSRNAVYPESLAAAADMAMEEEAGFAEFGAPPSPPMMQKMSATGRSASRVAAASVMDRGEGYGGGGYSGAGETLGQELLKSMDSGTSSFDPKTVETMLVRQGNIDIVSDPTKLESLADEATSLVTKRGGFVAERNTYRNRVSWGKRRGEFDVNIHMTLKVPVMEFFATTDAIKALVDKNEIASSSDSVEDVTDQFVDVAARAATLDATQMQLVKLMEKANEIEQVLKIQRELSNVVQQLEAKKARMHVLQQKSGTSTIHLNLRPKDDEPEPPKPRPGWSIFRTFKRAFIWLSKMCTRSIDVLVFVVVGGIPLWVVGLLVVKLCGGAGGGSSRSHPSPN